MKIKKIAICLLLLSLNLGGLWSADTDRALRFRREPSNTALFTGHDQKNYDDFSYEIKLYGAENASKILSRWPTNEPINQEFIAHTLFPVIIDNFASENNIIIFLLRAQVKTSQDVFSFVKWCNDKADQGNTKAQYVSAWMKYYGKGAVKDLRGAFDLLSLLSKNKKAKYHQVNYMLGVMYLYGLECEKNEKIAFKLVKSAAKEGLTAAESLLGWMYYNKRAGIDDLKSARKWLAKASAKGNQMAQLYLGHMFYQGLSVQQSYHTAFLFYQEAALSGNIEAQKLVRDMYQDGRGIDQNIKMVDFWRSQIAKKQPAADEEVQIIEISPGGTDPKSTKRKKFGD